MPPRVRKPPTSFVDSLRPDFSFPSIALVLTLLAFLFALTLLIAVHEYGHYRMAVACGVPVLVFSIGFGKCIYRWRPLKQDRVNRRSSG